MTDLPTEGYCESCRAEHNLRKGRRRFSAQCGICNTWTLLWRDVPDIPPPRARTRFSKAKDIKKGDRFSSGGSFKTYEAQTNAAPDPHFKGKVKITVKDGARERIATRMEENSICTVYIGNNKEEGKT